MITVKIYFKNTTLSNSLGIGAVKLLMLKGEKGDKGEPGDITSVKVNGVALEKVGGSVDVPVPTKTSDLNNDSGFIDNTVDDLTNYYDKTEINSKIASVYKYKGSVNTYADLPSTDLTVGDVYNVATADTTHHIKAGDNVAWTGTTWDVLAGEVDLSDYYTKTQTDTLLNGKADTSDIPTKTSDLTNDSGFITDTTAGDMVVDSIRTKNMLDTNELLQGSVSATTGDYDGDDIYSVVSGYIKVKANQPYTIKLNNALNGEWLYRIVLYSTPGYYSSTILNTQTQTTEYTFTPTINGYVRLCFTKNNFVYLTPDDIAEANPQLEEGSTATSYKQGQNLHMPLATTVNNGLMSAEDKSNLSKHTDKLNGTKPMGEVVVDSIRSKNLFNPYNVIQGTVNPTTGEYSNNTIAVTNAYTPVKAGVTYTLKLFNANDEFIFRIVSFDIYKNFYSTLVNNVQVTEQSFTPVVSGYIRVCFGKGSWTNVTTQNIINARPQLEENSTYSDYKPYQELANQDTYSPNEQVVGTWIDGKPIYRKVISSTTFSSTYIIADNIENIVDLKTIVYRSDYGICEFVPSRIGNTMSIDYDNFQNIGTTDSTLGLTWGSGWQSGYGGMFKKIVIIAKYTKTTDEQ